MGEYTDILGREDFKNRMRYIVAKDKLAHAYILNGEEGIGKKTMARILSMTINCDTVREKVDAGNAAPEDIVACKTCHSCIQASSDNNPDIIFISPEDDKRSISVDDIRKKLVEDAAIKPYKAKYKIYIIDRADTMTVEAQNAMLKTLEEPPAYIIIILLTSSEAKLLDTIRSRCESYEIPAVDSATVENYLKGCCPDSTEEEIKFAVKFADGRIGKGIRVLTDEDFQKVKDVFIEIMVNIQTLSMNDINRHIRTLAGLKDTQIDAFFDLLELWFKDILLFETTRDANGVVFKEYLPKIDKQSQNLTYGGLDEINKAIEKARERLKAAVSFDIAMQMLFMTIREKIIG